MNSIRAHMSAAPLKQLALEQREAEQAAIRAYMSAAPLKRRP